MILFFGGIVMVYKGLHVAEVRAGTHAPTSGVMLEAHRPFIFPLRPFPSSKT